MTFLLMDTIERVFASVNSEFLQKFRDLWNETLKGRETPNVLW